MTDIAPRPGDGRGEFAGVLVSRPDIARLAGVKRPAVSNWERRHTDYPSPVPVADEEGPGAEPGRFRADEVLTWLSTRAVPSNALRPGEPAGTTYGDRFRAALAGTSSGGMLKAVARLAGPEAERVRGPMSLADYLEWLLYLVFVAVQEPHGWKSAVDNLLVMEGQIEPPEKIFPRRLMAEIGEVLDRSLPVPAHESLQAFDHVLTTLLDADAREGGEYRTPRSVSRVMAGTLAAVQPAAPEPHDPYCRAGELLVAYRDAVTERGGSTGPGGSGRARQERALRLARMNLRMHGALGARLQSGPAVPALGPGDPAAAFDLVITNPPFGTRVPSDVPEPPYWKYGPARRSEFDWLQYVVSRLAPGGRAAVLMPAAAAFTGGAAQLIRSGLVEAGVVECVIALPAGLFALTAVKTQIWLLRAPGTPQARGRDVLFVDGGALGHSVTRTQRALSDDEIALLVREYEAWNRAAERESVYGGTPGLSRAVPTEVISEHGHRLEPHLYVRDLAPGPVGTGETRARLDRLAAEIETLRGRVETADAEAVRRLRRYGL
ncbi:N-6 DNA methylase [Streptomyces sp. NPDC093094]|uniref:N-6 DNA methylase n=1 Tax=Streptomyces sp. NPDC093094 TaxID=3366026 RepID=UPI003815B9A1